MLSTNLISSIGSKVKAADGAVPLGLLVDLGSPEGPITIRVCYTDDSCSYNNKGPQGLSYHGGEDIIFE